MTIAGCGANVFVRQLFLIAIFGLLCGGDNQLMVKELTTTINPARKRILVAIFATVFAENLQHLQRKFVGFCKGQFAFYKGGGIVVIAKKIVKICAVNNRKTHVSIFDFSYGKRADVPIVRRDGIVAAAGFLRQRRAHQKRIHFVFGFQ